MPNSQNRLSFEMLFEVGDEVGGPLIELCITFGIYRTHRQAAFLGDSQSCPAAPINLPKQRSCVMGEVTIAKSNFYCVVGTC